MPLLGEKEPLQTTKYHLEGRGGGLRCFTPKLLFTLRNLFHHVGHEESPSPEEKKKKKPKQRFKKKKREKGCIYL